MRRRFTFEHRRPAFVSGFADLGIELNAAEEIHAELASRLLSSTTREDVDLIVAVGADEVAHVLDHARDIYFHLTKHFDSLACILQGYIGGGGNHNCRGERNSLDQRQSYVACAWR